MSHGTTLHRGRKAAAATLIAAAAIALTAYQDTEADAAGAPSTATGGTATGKYASAPGRTAGDRPDMHRPFGGAVLDQRGATHPGSWVSPVGVG
ncbi:hypothetical protein ACIRPT_22545 [Streptomyces sp. NPDC101227]|uniref:hypothetical protein n=1 Tax=Streptomyces sp. NPDC101227 TaxID=3366136 RepID=UPI00381B6348